MQFYRTDRDWLGQAPSINISSIQSIEIADIVIVGSGHAGIQAALAAAESGSSVIVLEKQSEKNHKILGEDIGVWNSKWQISHGFGPYNEGEIVHEFVKRCGGRVNPELIRQYVHFSGEMFDHMVSLVERAGDPANILHYSTGEDGTLIVQTQKDVSGYPIELGGYKTWAAAIQFVGEIAHEPIKGIAARSNLPKFQQYAIREAQRLGAVWHYSETADVLIQNAAGNVIGVIAHSKDGIQTRYYARKAVLVATGDFGQNKEMCTALLTEPSEWAQRDGHDTITAQMGRDGLGHKMCCWAGGLIEPSPRAVMNQGGIPNAPWGYVPMLWLNRDGKRFCNEAAVPAVAGAISRQPRGLYTLVTDANYMKSISLAGVEHGGPNYGRPVYYDELQKDMEKVAKAGPKGAYVRRIAVIERDLRKVYGADTLEELLHNIGYTGEALEQSLNSIRHYNELCHQRQDSDFGKDAKAMIPVERPPFFAVPGNNDGIHQRLGLVTVTGLVTDDTYNVLRVDGSNISGLYVAGNTLGGRFGIAYSTPCAGASIGMAMTHGRLVGKTMAQLPPRRLT